MTDAIRRCDPGAISASLKEAVVDSLLNATYSHISGDGPDGLHVYGARPRLMLNSGFLLPQRDADGDDEVVSPIWISSHGLQLQLEAAEQGVLTISPSLSVYVRVLPTLEDLNRADCSVVFRLRPETANELRSERRRRLESEWEQMKGSYSHRYAHPEWPAVVERIGREVYLARGLIDASSAQFGDVEETDSNKESASADVVPITGVSARARDEDFESLSIPHKWHRLTINLPPLSLTFPDSEAGLTRICEQHSRDMNVALAEQLREWASSSDPDSGGRHWGYRSEFRMLPSQFRQWPELLSTLRSSPDPVALPNITLGWTIRAPGDWRDSSRRNFFIALENKSQSPRQFVDETEDSVFQVKLSASIPTRLHCHLRLDRLEPSYRYNRYLQQAAIGHNCGVTTRGHSASTIDLETSWTPRYTQPRLVPTDVPGVETCMRALSHATSLDNLKPLTTEFERWIRHTADATDIAAGIPSQNRDLIQRERAALANDVSKWTQEMAAISKGLEILEASKRAWTMRGAQSDQRAAVYEAWLAMNESMADFMNARFGHDTSTWRLFQLAFIISSIPALASRLEPYKEYYDARRDDAVTLLYFPTGGGKSEAFFGLLVFALFLDRLRGKNVGVTAMLRYPLRLLTIQQAQRCARVLAKAELVRQSRSYEGHPFTIGFWVGSGGSPNSHRDKGVQAIPDVSAVSPSPQSERDLQESNQQYAIVYKLWNKLPACPFCGAVTALRTFRNLGGTLAHVCTSLDCASNSGSWTPLPFLICDDDIYDLAPSVLLGTVDKLALIGHSPRTIRRVYAMLGSAPWLSSSNRLYVPTIRELAGGPSAHGMTGIYPAYKSGTKHFTDPYPCLVIQDEAHLLDESLGTFAGLFESTLDAVLNHLAISLGDIVARDSVGRPRRPKVIAASATVSHPERQLEHLYQRPVPATQFPYPGPSLYESFYAIPQRSPDPSRTSLAHGDDELGSQWARIYSAFMTNGKPHTATSVAILSAFHTTITRTFTDLTNDNAAVRARGRAYLESHVSDGPLRQHHRDTLAHATDGELASLIDLHRIALTYVTNKKGGDQIMAAESEETRKRHQRSGLGEVVLDTRLITGSVEQGAIKEVVEAAQTRVAPGEVFTPLEHVIRSIIATSAISHGVDVEELNSMFFAGMPSDIAEYIQASSRVGRTHAGFVVLIPTPQRRRDRHVIEVFEVFHRFLERMVQPAAIDRWAERAVERAFPSVIQAYLVGVTHARSLIDREEDRKQFTSDFASLSNVRTEYLTRREAFVREISDFVELAVGLRDGYCPEGEEYYRRLVDGKVRALLDTWERPDWATGNIQNYFNYVSNPSEKPMTSLRDVDQGGVIGMAYKDGRGRKQRPRDLVSVMDMIRHGVTDNSDTSESSGPGER